MIRKDQIITWLKIVAGKMHEEKDLLTHLDAEIGDADHGINMERGFSMVMKTLPSLEGKDIGSILRTTGMTLISSVGGASGPLYGTFFIDASKSAMGKETLSDEELTGLFQGGIAAIKRLGKASLGDKTMLDTLEPALAELQEAVSCQVSLTCALEKMAAAAQSGMQSTTPLIARKGRASYLGERSIGHQDPGATSAFFLVESLRRAVQAES